MGAVDELLKIVGELSYKSVSSSVKQFAVQDDPGLHRISR